MKGHNYPHGIVGKKILILGPLPPPLGGVSVHIERIAVQLRVQGNRVYHYDATPYDRYGIFGRVLRLYTIALAIYSFLVRPDIVYYHTSYTAGSPEELSFLVSLKRFYQFKMVLIEHDCRHLYVRSSHERQRFIRACQVVDAIICIGDKTYASYIDADISPATIQMNAAFIPPAVQHKQRYMGGYPSSMRLFMRQHAGELVLLNASQVVHMAGSGAGYPVRELYGLYDTLVQLDELVQAGRSLGLLLVLARGGNQYVRAAFVHELERGRFAHLRAYVYLLEGQYQLWPLYDQVDLFVRPTYSDGCSISVQEALWAGCPAVLASDVCWRPPGVRLFKTGDKLDYQRALLDIMYR